jgi:outer membrane biosynthesis protein TonB
MRLGWLGSPLAHGALVMALLATWPQSARRLPSDNAVVPIDVVNFSDVSNVKAIAAIAPPAPVDQPKAQGSPQPVAPPPQDVEPIPDTTVKPPPKPQTHASVDLNKLQELIDRSKKTSGQSQQQTATNAERGPDPRRGAGLQNNLSANEMDYLAAKFQHCWRDTRDAPDPARLRVVVHITLAKNGALKGEPQIVFPTSIAPGDAGLLAAARNALNAVRICAPFSEFSPARYAYWREFDLDMHSNGEIE